MRSILNTAAKRQASTCLLSGVRTDVDLQAGRSMYLQRCHARASGAWTCSLPRQRNVRQSVQAQSIKSAREPNSTLAGHKVVSVAFKSGDERGTECGWPMFW
jgi:hypothetical protein